MIRYYDVSNSDLPSDYPPNEVFLQIVAITIMVSVIFGFMHKVIVMQTKIFLLGFYFQFNDEM